MTFLPTSPGDSGRFTFRLELGLLWRKLDFALLADTSLI